MLETQQSIVRCLALFLRLENERHQLGAILDGEQLLYSYRSHRISTEIDFARSARSEDWSDCSAPAVV
jgi:hypothetical protein